MLVDTISNEFENAFAAWPFRFFGVTVDSSSNLILGFKPQPQLSPAYGYDVTSIESWIEGNI